VRLSPPTRFCALTDLQHNILITNETPPRACLADFGLSTLAPSTQGGTATTTTGGTPTHMAPEILVPSRFGQSSARPTQPADIYALGMVIYEVLTGSQPFYEQKWVVSELTYHVVSGERPAKPSNAEQIGFGGGTWELVEECWTEEAAGRPTIDLVLSHLTRVAASSTVVDPTPEKPHESTGDSLESGLSSKLSIPPARHDSHLDTQGKIRLFTSSTSQNGTVTPDGAVSPVSTISTVSTLASTVPSSITPVPSGNNRKGSRLKGNNFSGFVHRAS